MSVETHGAAETEALGRRLGAALQPGDVIALIGPYGAGKTTFVRGLAAGAGCDPARVASPTFVLLRVYEGRVTVHHFDCHRIADPEELRELGHPDLTCFGAAVLEWADRAKSWAGPDVLEIRIDLRDPEERSLEFRPTGVRSRALLSRADLDS